MAGPVLSRPDNKADEEPIVKQACKGILSDPFAWCRKEVSNNINKMRNQAVYTPAPPATPHENLQYSSMIRMNATAANGAYWRIIALMLIFLAAFRYFSDSERKEVDRWDIPAPPKIRNLN